ncbi:MAG: toprim domain-containing protein [Terrimicrobiaceae bacterium]|nr:toprim domain-containing protein [Terrimicrobiaceae bacterium]
MNPPRIICDRVHSAQVEQLRAIPLEDLLAWHGLGTRVEGRSLRAKSDQHNIVVSGDRWFDNKAGIGGAGAIDLQMHLGGEDFSSACQTLTSRFQPGVSPPTGKEAPRQSRSERLPFAALMAKYAARDDTNWPAARAYLVETRRIEAALVDELHAVGSIYANSHRPNPSLVFLHRTECGKVTGATLRDTRHDSTFRPCLGEKLSAWFAVGRGLRDARSVVAVESPIDALSYYTLFAGRSDLLAVVSCSGSSVPVPLMAQAYERRQPFIVALDRDAAGERGWRNAWDETADWTGFAISSEPPRGKDWNADLLALRPRREVARPQQAYFHA